MGKPDPEGACSGRSELVNANTQPGGEPAARGSRRTDREDERVLEEGTKLNKGSAVQGGLSFEGM